MQHTATESDLDPDMIAMGKVEFLHGIEGKRDQRVVLTDSFIHIKPNWGLACTRHSFRDSGGVSLIGFGDFGATVYVTDKGHVIA